MKRIIVALIAVCAIALTGAPAAAQQTTGNIQGRVLDAQKAAIPGVTVTAKQAATGFTRTEVTDAEGVYRLNALPVGTYDLKAELSGFAPYDHKGIVVNVGQPTEINVDLKVGGLAETVSVTAESPLIQTTTSSVGGTVDVGRIESLPLNGRQFANAAVTIPGVMLGFHSDPTKSTQFSPQIGGGNGRNVNYQIDGGDNNDDTVGGLLQLFPLEAIQEFQFVTSRYKAEYGRSNGGVMNIVTKGGTNDYRGSWFTLFRDTAMNAVTESERRADAAAVAANRTPTGKQDYRRYQYGGSLGGPIARDRAHFFAAFERTQQDTFQVVNTLGLFPEFDGPQPTPYRENLFTGKFTTNVTPSQYLAVRYGRNNNSQPYGASGLRAPNNWGQSTNEFNSINLNHNWVLGGGKLNEFIFQYADFANAITANSGDPQHTFLNGVRVGQNTNTPQATQQEKYQFRNDFTFSKAGWGGIGHDFKAGVNFINEPRLFLTFTEGTSDYAYTHADNTLDGPLTAVSINGGLAEANVPLKQYALYFQDDWRATNKLTLNLGLRYDLITGYQIDQSKNPNFVKVQAAGAAGLLKGIPGMENVGLEPKDDTDNIQPRVGFAYDVRGDGRDVIRGGWGIYYDMGYTNANVLFPAVDATGIGFGSIFSVSNSANILNPDGSFYRFGQPIANIASQNQVNTSQLPLFGQWLDPRFELPFTRQTAFGWSHQLMTNTVFTVDFVRNEGRDLGTRAAINARAINTPSTAARQLAFLNLQPNGIGTRGAISVGESEYNGLIMGIKRRMTNGFDLTATYTLAESKSNIGTAADELNQNNIQDVALLYNDPRTWGPTGRTDARHSGTLAAVWVKKGLTISPIFTFRSPLPIATIDGRDLNSNSVTNDLSAKAYKFTGFDGTTATYDEIGPCETWNCSRGAWRTLMNLRMSYNLHLIGSSRVELIGEVFNLFNAKNPGGFNTSQFTTAGAPNTGFMQPTTFAGDFQAGEQRVGQLGFRFTF
jgi:outer membrane receptor protein involved in Fe transport